MKSKLTDIINRVKDEVYEELKAEISESEFEQSEFEEGVAALFVCFDDKEFISIMSYEWDDLNIYFIMFMFQRVLAYYDEEYGDAATESLMWRVYWKFKKSFSRKNRVFQIVCLSILTNLVSMEIVTGDRFDTVYGDFDLAVIEEQAGEYPLFYADKLAVVMDSMRDEKSISIADFSYDLYKVVDEATVADYVRCLSNRCDSYITLKQYENFEEYAATLMEWTDKLDDDEADLRTKMLVKRNLYESIILAEQGKYVQAEQYALEGRELCGDDEDLVELKIALLNSLIICFFAQGIVEKCIECLNEGLQLLEEHDLQNSMCAATLYNTWNLFAEDEASPESAKEVMSWLWKLDVSNLPDTLLGMLLNSIQLNISNRKLESKDVPYVWSVLDKIEGRIKEDDLSGSILLCLEVRVKFFAYIGEYQGCKQAFDKMYWLSDRYFPDMDSVIELVCLEYDTIKKIMDRESLRSLLFALAKRTPLRLAQACDMGDERGLIYRVSRISMLFRVIVAAIYRGDIACNDNDYFEFVCNMKNVYPDVLRKRKLKFADCDGMDRLNELHRKMLDLDAVRYYGHEVDTDAVRNISDEMHELEKRIYTSKPVTSVKEFAWKNAGELAMLIPDKTVYIDYVQFTDSLRDVTEKDLRYGMVIAFRQGRQVYVKRLDMINAYNIRRVFGSLDIKIRESRQHGVEPGRIDRWISRNVETMLYNQLIMPAWRAAGPGCDIKRIIISGDIELSALAFDMLLDPTGRYLAERYDVNFVNSLRNRNKDLWLNELTGSRSDVINSHAEGATTDGKVSYEQCMVVGNPQFTIDKNLVSDRDGTFSALPLSKVEAQAAADALGTDVIQKKKVSKDIFRELHVPVLHIATHGEHLYDGDFLEKNESLSFDMPLRTTCFFTSGANDWIATGRIDERYGTGLVSAEEICTYDWSGVRLVVMSACFSGVGEISYDEGLLGMNTAFAAQGVQASIISMWEVDDLASAVLMTRFYDNLKYMSVSEALWRAKQYLMNVTVGDLTQDGWFGEQRVRRMGLVADNIRKISHYPSDTKLFANPVYWAGFALWI